LPARDDHLQQARHNTAFLDSIDKRKYRDWAVTVTFYVGLHYIDAFLAHSANVHPPKHKQRDNLVASVKELRPIFADYSALKSGSFNARYMPPTSFTDGDVRRLIDQHLGRIKTEVAKYLPS
jgi:hypothetical protein